MASIRRRTLTYSCAEKREVEDTSQRFSRNQPLRDDFRASSLAAHWTPTLLGLGSLDLVNSALRMNFPAVARDHYADAQIDDYAGRARADFPWTPPLRMEVRARSSHPAAIATSTQFSNNILRGTAGFGFWNFPFSVRGDILFLPESIWFFYASPPSNMALVPASPGWGWKAQVVHSMRPGALAALVPTALAAGWARLSGRIEPAARWVQRLSGASEATLSVDMTRWHTYVLEWHRTEARFWVDDVPVLRVPNPPTRPLGFVAWLDNQYAIATPRGSFRFGTVATEPEWFEIDSIDIYPLK